MLNLIPGLGYLYLGKRRVFALLLITSLIFSLSSLFDPAVMVRDDSFASAWELVVTLASAAAFEAAFVYDAYREAAKSNKNS